MVIHTSGTTGLPRARDTHGGFRMKIAHDALLHFDVRAGDVLFWPADMDDSGRWCGICLNSSPTMVCYEVRRIFRIGHGFKIIERHRVNAFCVRSYDDSRLRSQRTTALAGDTSSIRVLITGANPLIRSISSGMAAFCDARRSHQLFSGSEVSFDRPSVVVKPFRLQGSYGIARDGGGRFDPAVTRPGRNWGIGHS